MLTLSIVFVVSALAGLLLTPLVIRFAVARSLYDAPHGERRVHTEPVPRLGGVAVFLAMASGLLVAALAALRDGTFLVGPPGFIFGVIFGGGIVFVTGLVDDLRGLQPGAKLVAQFVAALVVYAYGFRMEAVSLGGSLELSLGWLSLPISVLWIVGVTNAFNLIDGLDGLATGLALVALSATLTVAVVLGHWEVVLLCAALLGALLAFLRFNFSPARIFLGDSGSLVIGFLLAVLTTTGSQLREGSSAVLILVPLFALALPLLDTGLAMLRRWLRGVPMSQADGRHIHHRLLALALTHRHAVIVLYVMASMLAVLGISLVFAPRPAVVSVAAAGGGVTLFVLLYGLRRLQYHEFAHAGAVLASGMVRARSVIRNQIYAQDAGESVRQARSLEEVNAVLEESATTFGFLHMELCREGAPGSRPLVLFDGHVARAWKLDYPVMSSGFAEADDYVLRIWCNPRNGSRPHGAERVSQIVAPAIEAWMARQAVPRRATAIHVERPERETPTLEAVAEVLDRAHAATRLGARVRPGV